MFMNPYSLRLLTQFQGFGYDYGRWYILKNRPTIWEFEHAGTMILRERYEIAPYIGTSTFDHIHNMVVVNATSQP